MRRALVSLLVTLAVIGVGGWAADTWVRGRAEEQVAVAIQNRLALTRKPDVSLGGFPFSLVFLTRTVPSARLLVGRVPVPVSGAEVSITGVRVESDGISLAGGELRVAKAAATGVLDYGNLGTLAGVPVSYAGDGRVALTYTARVGGQLVTVGVTAEPRLDADAARIRLARVELAEQSAAVPLSPAQLAKLARPIPVVLPDGVRLTAVAPAEGGLAVAATATGLTVRWP